MPGTVVNWPKWYRIINERFIPLVDNRDRYLILWGGRGSSKSIFAAKKLIYRCLTEKYFRFILIRKQYNSIKDSQFQTLKDLIIEMGLDSVFHFKESPLEITCDNGNKFLARGCDDAKKMKSIKDPTGAWYEEEIVDEKDFITITTSIRTTKADYLQEIFTINPEVEGEYEEHWFWKRFFKGKLELNFHAFTTITLDSGEEWRVTYTSHHSTYRDNRWISNEFVAFLLSLRETNEYYYTIYCEGNWGNKMTSGQFYKLFSRVRNGIANGKNSMTGQPDLYNPDLPLQLTWDFNVKPYVTCNIHQMFDDAKKAIQIDEVCLSTPNNNTPFACREVVRRYANHGGGMNIYGDPAGWQDDTKTEKGFNDYVLIRQELNAFHPTLKVMKQAPPVVMRGNFVNTVFATGYMGISFFIGYNCPNTINDYLFLKEAADGLKAKQKIKDTETDVTYEKYGHTSDANDYFYCTAYQPEFVKYQKGGSDMKVTVGKNFSKHRY
jgi:PBSX family phage terminase large subunit